MEEITKNKYVRAAIKIFWIFVICSFLGSIIEMGYVIVHANKIEIRRGLIYGFFVQVYGMGAVAYYILCNKVKKPYKVFLIGMIMGGVIEYIFSLLQEIFLGSVSWDYSDRFLNFNGRTCLQYCIYWGIIAIVFLKLIYPLIQKMDKIIYTKIFTLITVFMLIYMSINVWISTVAVIRQEERKEHIPASSKFEEYLDRKFPDEFLQEIYQNKKSFD